MGLPLTPAEIIADFCKFSLFVDKDIEELQPQTIRGRRLNWAASSFLFKGRTVDPFRGRFPKSTNNEPIPDSSSLPVVCFFVFIPNTAYGPGNRLGPVYWGQAAGFLVPGKIPWFDSKKIFDSELPLDAMVPSAMNGTGIIASAFERSRQRF